LENIIVGNRIPFHYFVTKGSGSSDLTIHAGSYHLALKAAGIEQSNIMTYSSILPSIATEIPRPGSFVHGAVMESILSVCTVNKGERATAGIIYGWLLDKKFPQIRYGGLVCEIYGDYSEEGIRNKLTLSLDELYFNGYSDDWQLGDPNFIIESFVSPKQYGTALAAICFVDYQEPVINPEK
jgi:arginine decarboxylase